MRALIVSCLFAFAAGFGHAASSEPKLPFFPDSQYHPDVATVEQVLGYPLGQRISEPAAIARYFEQLAANHPERIKLVPY
ncbi:MAG: hypothetical protein LAT66_05015, partial [Alkalimonas sp.]|nr:hypothetical protein [Alkalimonas sp.]